MLYSLWNLTSFGIASFLLPVWGFWAVLNPSPVPPTKVAPQPLTIVVAPLIEGTEITQAIETVTEVPTPPPEAASPSFGVLPPPPLPTNASATPSEPVSPSEHDAHRPLKLPDLETLPKPAPIDLKNDPIYQEIMKSISSDRNITLVADASTAASLHLSEGEFAAVEKLLKVARKLAGQEKKLRKKGDAEGADRVLSSIRQIRGVAIQLLTTNEKK